MTLLDSAWLTQYVQRNNPTEEGSSLIISFADKRTEALPSNRIQRLGGDRAGLWSIRINLQWRICFVWQIGDPGPSDVEIVDYH